MSNMSDKDGSVPLFYSARKGGECRMRGKEGK